MHFYAIIAREEDKLTLRNSRLFKANLGNSSTFKALNSGNKTPSKFNVCKAPYEPYTDFSKMLCQFF